MLRINESAGTIEKLDCDGNWQQWFPPNGGSDPGLGAAMRQAISDAVNNKLGSIPDPHTAPTVGECREYDLYLQANNNCLLPIHVDEGDLITITDVKGTWSEGGGDGVVFRFTDGAGVGFTQSTDPLVSASHMRLIMNVNGVWYDAYNITDFPIPAGVITDNLIFQANDDEIQDNRGGVAFHIKICKADVLPYTWHHVFDWSNSALPESPFYGTGFAWSAGVGFVGGITDNKLKFDTPDSTTKVKYIEAWYDPGLEFAASIDEGIYANGTTIALTPDLFGTTAAAGNHFIYNLSSNDTNYSYIVVYWHAPGSGKATGTLYKLDIRGVGVDPFSGF